MARWRSFGPEWNPALAALAYVAALLAAVTSSSWLAGAGLVGLLVGLVVAVAE